jgi:outer membrane protein OmpA-like peptidoglycan-associated protein
MVTDGAIEVCGILPDDLRTQWIAELADLAAVLGYRLDDRTEIAAGAAAGPQEANELLVRFPGAIVFRPDSPQSFDGAAQPIFEAVAGVLNRGTADLNIVGYADPTDPDAVLLALARAEHVHEHLVDLSVDGERLTVEARPPAEAPIVAAEGSPIERRADLEFRFRP